MNFSPQNDQSLLDLIGALKGGLDPNTAYSMYQGVQQDQAQRIADRQTRLTGMADLLTGNAMAGMPYSGASAIAEAQPGPAGPAVQQMLSSLYPTAGDEVPRNASGAVMDFPTGSGATVNQPMGATAPNYLNSLPQGAPNPYAGPQAQDLGMGATAMSPAFQPAPPSPTEAIAQQQMQQEAELAPLWQEFVANAQGYAAEGKPKEQFLVEAARAYPELFAGDIENVQQIVLTIFAQPTVPAGG